MKISVVIPLYNKYNSVIRAILSILNQTVQPYEIVVVNDGSTDGSEKLVKKFNNPLIRMINQPNAGVSAARNKGIEETNGDWIAFLDADDEWNPEFLETIHMLYVAYPQCNILATSYVFQDHQGTLKNIILRKIPFPGKHGILNNYFEVASCSHPPIWTSAVTVKKEAVYQIGGFPIGVKSGEDLLTWAKLTMKYQIAYCLNPLAVFYYSRVDPKIPNRKPDIPDFVGNELKKMILSSSDVSLKNYYGWYKKNRSIHAYECNDRFEFLFSIIESIKYSKFSMKNILLCAIFLVPKTIYFYFKNKR